MKAWTKTPGALEKPRIAINYKIQTGPEDQADQMCWRSIYIRKASGVVT